MKRIILCLLIATGITHLSAQSRTNESGTVYVQPHQQLSDGGQPWAFKFDQHDATIVYETMPNVDVNALMAQDELLKSQNVKTFRFGFDHYVSYTLQNSGTWINLDNGDKVWRLGVHSPGAISLNFSFKSMNLPEGCKLFVYREDKKEFYGAFTQKYVTEADKMLGTELLFSDKAVIELYVPQSAANDVYLEVWRITHGYRDLGTALMRAFGASGSCENNARCPAYAAWDNQIRSGICLVNGGEFCSAALINNTCNDGTPYVLTANHCGSSGFGSWTFRFNWEAPGCPNPGSSPSSNSISGSVQRAAFAGSDMSLLQMNSTPPAGYNVYYAGWDRNNTATTNPFGVHHPSGDIKKFSQATGTALTATYGGATCWQTPTWTDGVTEPGSSGSPLFNNAGLIIGQLYGGPSDCTCENNATCGYDYYGKLFTSWTGGGTNATRLSNWLDPCSTGATTLLGYDPNAPTIALDAGISSITTPATGTSTCNTTFTPVVVLRNYGSTTLTSCTINYHLDAASPSTYNWTGSLTSGTTTNITLPGFTTTAGAHTYTAFTSNPNSGTDGNAANNSQTSNFTVTTAPAGAPLPFTEGFQAVTFPPTGWTVQNADANMTWARTTAAGGFATSTASALFDNFSPATSIAGQSDYLVTPAISFASASGTLQMTFDVAYAPYNATYYDSLIVSITTDCGATWTRLYNKGNTGLATAAATTANFVPTAAQWRTETVPLNSYIGLSSVQLRFQNRSGWGNNIYVDNVNLSFTPAVPPTADFTASSTTVCAGSTVNFTNTSTGATSYSWTFTGGTPATSTATNPSVVYNTPGTYNVSLVATNASGNDTETKPSYITVVAAPTTATAGTDQTSCAGTTVNLAGNTATSGTGLWTQVSGPSSSITTASSPTSTVTGMSAGGTYVYQWTISNSPCPASNDQVSIVVSTPPTTSAAGVDQNGCTGSPVTLAGNIATSGTGAWSQVSGPSSTITTPSSPSSTVTGLAAAGTYVYQWTITNAPCTASSDQVTITVNTSPTAAAGTDITICEGGSTTLNGSGSGTYSWTPAGSLSSSTIANPVASPATTTTYTLTVTNGTCTANDAVVVTVSSVPTPTISISSDTLYATPSGGFSYQWYFNGSPIPGATNSFYVFTANGDYTVEISNGVPCASTSAIETVTTTFVHVINGENSFVIYPNPSEGFVTLKLNESLSADNRLTITNTIGEIVYVNTLNQSAGNTVELRLNHLAKGMYYLTLNNGSEKMSQKIMIK